MTDGNETEKGTDATSGGPEEESRREFLKKLSNGAVKGAVTIPAVALLLSAKTRPAEANSTSGTNCGCGCGS